MRVVSLQGLGFREEEEQIQPRMDANKREFKKSGLGLGYKVTASIDKERIIGDISQKLIRVDSRSFAVGFSAFRES
jgi:hypothetical protein